MEVGDHDHGADHDDPDQGGQQDERGGEGVEHLDKEETEDKEKNGFNLIEARWVEHLDKWKRK